MQIIQLAYALANIPTEVNPKRYIGMRKKVAKSIWRLWNISKAAQNAMQCHSVFIGDYTINILGTREGLNCKLSVELQGQKLFIKADTLATEFTDKEISSMYRILRYNIASNTANKKEKLKPNEILENINGKYLVRLPFMTEYTPAPDKTPQNIKGLSAIEIIYNTRNGTTAIAGIHNT